MSEPTARTLARMTAVGVAVYVGAWLVAGWWTPGYDPVSQAISELFAVGSPSGPRWLVIGALLVTGVMLAAFGPALDVLLPGSGRAAPIACTVSGVATVLVALVPCTSGCPGFGTTTSDSLHLVAASTAYFTLVATPLLAALRVRDHDRAFTTTSLVFGLVAIAGLALGASSRWQSIGGLLQRGYNTTADLWLVVAGWWLAGRPREVDDGSD